MWDTEKNMTDTFIYKRYLDKVKGKPGWTVLQLALHLHVTRRHIYNVIERVEHGNSVKIRAEAEQSRLESLWRHKYSSRFRAIPKDRKPATVQLLRQLIRDMAADEFNQAETARLLKKARSTVISHL